MVGLEYILFFVGIFLLIKGATYLVEGASSLAKKLGISSLVIGLTIVAFGTSMPELVVNVFAAFKGSAEIAFGNIIGSNLSNIFLILGILAVMGGVYVQYSTISKEIPFTILSVLILFILANKMLLTGTNNPFLTRIDGLVLLGFFAIFMYYSFSLIKASRAEVKKPDLPKYNPWRITLMILGGLIALYLGGVWTVEGAIYIAKQFGLSEFLISATIVALGTSLPELVTSLVALKKNEANMAIGNIIGSNIFNIFWILGLTALIKPIPIPLFINVDLIILGIATLMLMLFMFTGVKRKIDRWEGAVFLMGYLSYLIFLIIRG